jgi:thioredoxin-related protein
MLKTLRLFALIGLVGLTFPAHAWFFSSQPTQATIPLAKDFQQDGQTALRDKKLILIYLSATHCFYCETLKKEIISPLLVGGLYKDAILLRNVVFDSDAPVRNFEGESQSPDAFMMSHFSGAGLTPTLLFVNGQGDEIAERIVGYNNFEFYSYELEQRINTALKALGSSVQFNSFNLAQ